MEGTEPRPTVLVVDDEQPVADTYSELLAARYEVRTAYTGEEALDHVDLDVDVVLLDRRMPDPSGDEVLSRIRSRGYNCRVVMITAVEPEVDILSLDFDEYVTKPVEPGHDGEQVRRGRLTATPGGRRDHPEQPPREGEDGRHGQPTHESPRVDRAGG